MPTVTRFQACLAVLLLTSMLDGCAHDATPPGFTPVAASPASTGAGPGKSARSQTGG